MIVNLSSLYGSTVEATDGPIGSVRQFLFHEQSWEIRSVVVSTGDFLMRKDVLVAPEAFRRPFLPGQQFRLSMRVNEILSLLSVDRDTPESDEPPVGEQETLGRMVMPATETLSLPSSRFDEPSEDQKRSIRTHRHQNPYLHSSRELRGYAALQGNNALGVVDDFLIDLRTWKIQYCVVNLGGFFEKSMGYIPSPRIRSINWEDKFVELNR